jgi:hypothetical protein
MGHWGEMGTRRPMAASQENQRALPFRGLVLLFIAVFSSFLKA